MKKCPVTGITADTADNGPQNTEAHGVIHHHRQERESGKDPFSRIPEYMEAHYNEQVSLKDVAEYAFLNRTYVSELFPKKLGMSFTRYRNYLRVRHACAMLEKSDMSMTEIAQIVGYDALSSFSRTFRAIKGMPPQQYRKMYRGQKKPADAERTMK